MTEPVPFDFKDKKQRALKATCRGLRLMQMTHDYKKLGEMCAVMTEDVGLPAFVQALLLWQQPSMTIEEACDLVDNYRENGGETLDLVRAIAEALGRSGHLVGWSANGADPNVPTGTPNASAPATE